jgi:hypothetical protein
LPKGSSNNLLRGCMAALRGARMLAYLGDMSRILRSGRLALPPLATVLRCCPEKDALSKKAPFP